MRTRWEPQAGVQQACAGGREGDIVYVWVRMYACIVLADKGKSGLPGKDAR